MTLSTTPNRISYAGNSIATVFAFPYYFIKEEDLVVILKNNTTGVEVTQIITTNFTILGEGEQAGGSVTMLVAPPTGYTLTILRDPVPTQEVDLVENDKLPAETVERELDLLTMILQRHADLLDRSFVLTDGFATPFDVRLPALLPADASIVVNATGDGLAVGPTVTDISGAAANAAAAAASAAAAAASAAAAAAAVAVHAALTATHGVSGNILGTSDAQVITNKDIDGGTASNSRRITVPKNTKSNLDALTRKQGTLLYASDLNKLYSDDGSSLTEVGSGSGGGGSLKWVEAAQSPTPNINDAGMEVYDYAAGDSQSVYAVIKIPNGYVAGGPCKLRGYFYSPDNTGNVLIQTIATLIRAGVDAYNTTTNQRTSTNSAVSLSAGTVNELQAVLFDLSDSSGQINGVAISAGDIIKVQLTRGTDTATSDASVLVYAMEGGFS